MIHNYLKINPGQKLYDQSVIEDKGSTYFIIRDGLETCLIVHPADEKRGSTQFEGEWKEIEGTRFLKCPLSANNAAMLREKFPFTRPVLIGKNNSYGLGDRLGNAGPAHLKAIQKTEFKPVLAQQSIRELQRTGRTAQEVMDAASWAVFREGYKDGFGADGDHLKTTDDIDLMVKAGFTMFTIDPSDFVVNEAVEMDEKRLMEEINKLPWDVLNSNFEEFSANWFDCDIKLSEDYSLKPSRNEILAGLVKYGRVISHTKTLADYIDKTYPEHPAELELSVDETDHPTTLFEHYLIASELHRLGVDLVSLAPRFCGDFEKGVDFRGDLKQFKQEYLLHLAIAGQFGGYKLSIHSGSDKFSVYEAIGSLNEGSVHVKTAGTSYLEALRTVAEAAPDLFREILAFSKTRFTNDKKTYHISSRPENVPKGETLKDHQLKELLDDDDARQVLHVTFGSVLGGDSSRSIKLKEKLMRCLAENETLYERNLEKHFYRHLRSFN